MKKIFLSFILLFSILYIKAQSGDLMTSSFTVDASPITVNQQIDVIVTLHQNGPDDLPANTIFVTLGIPSNYVEWVFSGAYPPISDDCGGIWEVYYYDPASNEITITNSQPFQDGSACLEIRLPIRGTNVTPGPQPFTINGTVFGPGVSDPNGSNNTIPDPVFIEVVAQDETGTISGNVFNDINGGSINGTGFNAGGALFINIVDPVTGEVIDSVPVNSDGTYSITDIPVGDYNVELSTTQGIIGQPAPDPAVPSGYVNTNEGTLPVGDGTPDGTTTVSVTNGGNVTPSFGIQRRPETAISLGNENLPPSGSSLAIPGSYFSTSTNPSNPNTSDYDGGTVTSIRITTFPTNASSITIGGTTYTSATFPTGGVTTPYNSGNPDVSIAPSGAAGSVSTINFVAIDNAGSEDLTPGSIAITWDAAPCVAGDVAPVIY